MLFSASPPRPTPGNVEIEASRSGPEKNTTESLGWELAGAPTAGATTRCTGEIHLFKQTTVKTNIATGLGGIAPIVCPPLDEVTSVHDEPPGCFVGHAQRQPLISDQNLQAACAISGPVTAIGI